MKMRRVVLEVLVPMKADSGDVAYLTQASLSVSWPFEVVVKQLSTGVVDYKETKRESVGH